jgi:hypothetical protein
VTAGIDDDGAAAVGRVSRDSMTQVFVGENRGEDDCYIGDEILGV